MRRNTTLLCSHMLKFLSIIDPTHSQVIKQVHSVYSRLLFSPKHQAFSTFASITDTSVPSSSRDRIAQAKVDLSPVDCFGIAGYVINQFSHLFDGKEKPPVNASSLKDLLLDLSDVVPDISRRLRRSSYLKPKYVLELLLGIDSECGKVGVGCRKVQTLWEIFGLAGKQYKGFKHLHQSCEIMASMLIREKMLSEAEWLLMEMESQGYLMDNREIFSNLIEKYVGAGDMERAVLLFDWMKGQALVPTLLCYHALIDLLVQMKKTQSAYQVCLDLVTMRTKLNNVEIGKVEKVIELLCLDGKIQEARNLVRKLLVSGFEPSCLIVNKIACGYCEKQDFEDLLSFFAETKCAPDVSFGNNITNVLCRKFGAETANFFRQELENLGFKPDEITLGILIGWSCFEGDLRNAFLYLSEILSRGLKPDLHSYSALLGGVFKKGMWEHARLILDEMLNSGIIPNMSTFKILLAGYCRARRFGEAKMMIQEMVSYGLVEKSCLEDPLAQVFIILGFDPLAVRLKRDNDTGLSKTEFFDDLGNGLYLDTDLDEYEKRVNMVLDCSAIPDFNSLIRREFDHRNTRTALELVDKLVRWGQDLSYSVFSVLLKGLCASRSQIKASASLLERWPKLANQLDEENLNFLAQEYCNKGLTHQGLLVFRKLVQKHLPVYNETYTMLIKGLGKKGTTRDLQNVWAIAQKDKWLPDMDYCQALWESLFHKQMLKEALELFESILVSYPRFNLEICNVFLENLSVTGYSSVVHSLVEKLVEQGCVLEQRVYSHLIKGLCKEKKFLFAFGILDNMLAQNLAPCLEVSLILIPQLCRANELEKAIALVNTCLNKQPMDSNSVFRALMEGFCSTGKITEAENLFHYMSYSGVLPYDDDYNMLFEGHCQANNSRKCWEVLGTMIRNNMSLSVASYRKCVQMMCTEGRFSSALRLKELMLRDNKPRSLIVYNILIFYLFSAKNHLLVNKVLDEMTKEEILPDEVTYNFLVHGCSSCEDFASSLHHLSSMISKGFRPNSRSLRVVINSLCGLGDLRKALDLSQEMESGGWVHGSVIQTKIVQGLISNGKTQEAEDFLSRVKEKGVIPDTVNYDNLISLLCHFGRLEKAVNLLNIMLKKGSLPDSTSYDSIIQGFLKCNNPDKAMDFHTEMLDRGLNPSVDSWNMLINKSCEKGETEEAEKLVRSMIRVGETPTREMYTTVIDQYRLKKNVGKASEIMQLMQKSGYNPDFETHWSLISNLSTSSEKDNINRQGFLSRLLSGSGFAWEKDPTQKLRR